MQNKTNFLHHQHYHALSFKKQIFLSFDPRNYSMTQRLSPSFFKLINYLFIFWLHWVFVAARGLSLVAASGGYFSLQCAGFSLWWLLVAEHGL